MNSQGVPRSAADWAKRNYGHELWSRRPGHTREQNGQTCPPGVGSLVEETEKNVASIREPLPTLWDRNAAENRSTVRALEEGQRVGFAGGRLAIWAPEEGVPGKACQVKAPRSDCVRSRRELCPQRGWGPKGLAVVKAQPWTGTGVESATVGSEQRRASDSISFPSSKHPFGRSLGACQGGSRGREGGVGILDALPLGAGANRMRWRGGGGKREERMTQANPPPVLGLNSWREGVSAGRAGIAGWSSSVMPGASRSRTWVGIFPSQGGWPGRSLWLGDFQLAYSDGVLLCVPWGPTAYLGCWELQLQWLRAPRPRRTPVASGTAKPKEEPVVGARLMGAECETWVGEQEGSARPWGKKSSFLFWKPDRHLGQILLKSSWGYAGSQEGRGSVVGWGGGEA